jgi:hypothetical protein
MLTSPIFVRSAVFVMLLSSSMFNCIAQRKAKQVNIPHISKLNYLNTYVLPNNLQFEGTTVGGLSGIDYDSENNCYYLICDDRSHINPARFYKATIDISDNGINNVKIVAVDTLFQRDGSTYPELSYHATRTTDPEAMRFNQHTGTLIWTSEGDRVIKLKDTILIDPTITIISQQGRFVDSIPLPANLRMQLTEAGPRRNGVLEGATFADNFKNLYVSLEEALYQDGPRATPEPNHAYTRLYKFDLKRKKNVAQYAYQLEPMAVKPVRQGDFTNGIPDILWLGKHRLLVTERSYSGLMGSNVKVFEADLKGAENIIKNPAMLVQSPAQLVKKRLLLDMDHLGIYIDNIEGATIGPKLPNGHQTLVFVADNNFIDAEESQFMIFEVIP